MFSNSNFYIALTGLKERERERERVRLMSSCQCQDETSKTWTIFAHYFQKELWKNSKGVLRTRKQLQGQKKKGRGTDLMSSCDLLNPVLLFLKINLILFPPQSLLLTLYTIINRDLE
uniref:Uncharacterized protein n=1 Tax=Micrurus surinamensis TaxID=129470 RepID=A0A2D4NM17_MICSU